MEYVGEVVGIRSEVVGIRWGGGWNTLGRWSEYVPNLLEYVREVVGIRSEPTIPLKSRSHDVRVSRLIIRWKGVDMLPIASSVRGRKVRIRARVQLPNHYPVWW